MLKEFDLIEDFFAGLTQKRTDVDLGIGDDAALCRVPPGMQLAISVDTLVEGVHFPLNTAARAIGHKALAVNLSDMAAMGAEPAWVTLALTCPQVSETWLRNFSQGFGELARAHGLQLIGGDTTRGPLSLSVQIMGLVPQGQALCRHGAQPGDLIYVTGTLGDAGAGLASLSSELGLNAEALDFVRQRLDCPTPRVAAGLALRGIASSAIDISDGLLADLGHILQRSGGLGATLKLDALPLSTALQQLPLQQAQNWALSAGDDYELCFTISPQQQAKLAELLSDTAHTCIGEISAEPGLFSLQNGQRQPLTKQGFQHF